MALTFKDVAEILRIIDASNLEEVELEAQGIRVSVRRGSGAMPRKEGSATTENAARNASSEQNSEASAPSGVAANEGLSKPDGSAGSSGQGLEVRAPMVGTFYHAASPDKPPFVEVGQRVGIGDPLCLIEVMKLYTTIEASVEGVVHQVCAKNGDLVDFDALLFVILPD
ncbi:MAG: acetyl-CoA carboxylase biotin carboxyl carrier protein [Gammaproteobacteria bacterium]